MTFDIRLISDRLALGVSTQTIWEGIRKYLKSKAKTAIKVLKLKGIPYSKTKKNYSNYIYNYVRTAKYVVPKTITE